MRNLLFLIAAALGALLPSCTPAKMCIRDRVEHLRTGVRTCYEVDEQTTYWTLWNNGGQVPYCCPEPQTWTTNAPNAADPAAEGFRAIDPGESWRTTFRLYAK